MPHAFFVVACCTSSSSLWVDQLAAQASSGLQETGFCNGDTWEALLGPEDVELALQEAARLVRPPVDCSTHILFMHGSACYKGMSSVEGPLNLCCELSGSSWLHELSDKMLRTAS